TGTYFYGMRTIQLLLSQSGQTFAPQNFASGLRRLFEHFGKRPNFFVVTGEINTPMGRATGQPMPPTSQWEGSIFPNGRGRRGSEAPTDAPTAAEFTMAQIELRATLDLARLLPHHRLFNRQLDQAQVERLLKKLRRMVVDEIPDITGVDVKGRQFTNAPVH